MPAKKTKDTSTEEKIKIAARKIFTKKGYAATRTRDIAEEAGINLALLNYYFRSKEKLFHQIMEEKIHRLFGSLAPILHAENTSLDEKTEQIVQFYIDMLLKNPDLPLFVLNEIKNNPSNFADTIKVKEFLLQSHLVKQLHEARPDINPLQFVLSIIGMIIFPFIGRPVFESSGLLDEEKFEAILLQRKQLIPIWVKAMLEAK